MTAPRSLLYVPGDSAAKLSRALSTGAHALILDLEDAVPPTRKLEARATVAAWLHHHEPGPGDPELWVRVNAGGAGAEDIAAVVTDVLAGVVVPKCEGPAQLEAADGWLTTTERRVGLAPGSVAVAALVESARGVLEAPAIASGPRVVRLHLGEADLCGEIGLVPTDDQRELLSIRVHVVLASAAAQLAPPTGPVFRTIDDVSGLLASSLELRRLGFGSRSVVHPKQIQPVNEAFRPSDEELARARLVVEEFERRLEGGTGVYTDDDGMLVDMAVVRTARQLLERSSWHGKAPSVE